MADRGIVVIKIDPDSMPEPDELTNRLRQYITPVGADRVGVDHVDSDSLETVVKALAHFFDLA